MFQFENLRTLAWSWYQYISTHHQTPIFSIGKGYISWLFQKNYVNKLEVPYIYLPTLPSNVFEHWRQCFLHLRNLESVISQTSVLSLSPSRVTHILQTLFLEPKMKLLWLVRRDLFHYTQLIRIKILLI